MQLERTFLCPARDTVLGVDEACLSLTNTAHQPVSLWIQSTECYKCPPWFYVSVAPGQTAHQVVNTSYGSHLTLENAAGSQTLCRNDVHFGEFGWYTMHVNTSSTAPLSCSVTTKQPPANIYAPLLFVGLSLLLLAVVMRVWHVLYEKMVFHRLLRFCRIDSLLASDLGDPDVSVSLLETGGGVDLSPSTRQLQQRIRSLDVFRGVAVSLMIVVNYGGGGYWFLRHTPWNGLTIADLVFPWFLWITGASLFLSLRARARRSTPKSQVCVSVLRRCLLLFLLGLTVNSVSLAAHARHSPLSPSLPTSATLQPPPPPPLLRLPGVLQRIALSSGLVAAILLPAVRPDETQPTGGGRWRWLQDISGAWRQWLAVSLLVLLHTLVTFLLPVPGCPTGYLGAGGLYDGGRHANCTGGAAGYIDRLVLVDRLYRRPSCQRLYSTTVDYDPEGLLGTLTSCLVVYLGCVTGRIFVVYTEWKARAVRLAAWSAVLCMLGGMLCSFSVNTGPVPINKNMWSLSYALVSSGSAFALLAAIYVAVDVTKQWSGRPFYFAGLNALSLYVAHVVCARVFPVSLAGVARPLVGGATTATHMAHLFHTVWSLLVLLLAAWRLYVHRVFLSL